MKKISKICLFEWIIRDDLMFLFVFGFYYTYQKTSRQRIHDTFFNILNGCLIPWYYKTIIFFRLCYYYHSYFHKVCSVFFFLGGFLSVLAKLGNNVVYVIYL